jgi:hypothetical protein
MLFQQFGIASQLCLFLQENFSVGKTQVFLYAVLGYTKLSIIINSIVWIGFFMFECQ